VTGDGSPSAQRIHKPGSDAFHSYEVAEEAETSGELAPLSGGNAARDALQHSVGQGDGLARSFEGRGRRRGHREVVRAGPHRASSRRQDSLGYFRFHGGSYLGGGVDVAFGLLRSFRSRPRLAGLRPCSSSSGRSGGSRLRGVVGEGSGEGETQERIGQRREATRVVSERTRERKKASKQVKLAERGEFAA